jgi:hypothetical protein
MMRSAWIIALGGALAFGLWALLLATAAQGAEPTTCSWPSAPDSFQAVHPYDTWTAKDHNRILCAINQLETRAGSVGDIETACASVTATPGQRKAVTIGLSAAVTGSPPVFATVVEAASPALLQISGVQGASGTSATVWVFNHDALNSRSGTACVQVIR